MAWSLKEDWELTKKNMQRIGANMALNRESQGENAQMAEITNRYRMEEAAYYQENTNENAFTTVAQEHWYMHHLNRERMRHLGIKVQYVQIGNTPTYYDRDKRYPYWNYYREGKNRVCCLEDYTRLAKIYSYNGQVIYKDDSANKKKSFYITTAKTETDTYFCPNCGNEATLDNLLDGCDYCNTKFTLQDMNTKITSVYQPQSFMQERGGNIAWKMSFVLGLGEEKAENGVAPILLIKEDDPEFSEERFVAGLTNKILSIHYAHNMDDVKVFVEQDISELIQQCSHIFDVGITECLLLRYHKDDAFQYVDVLTKLRLLVFGPNGVYETRTALKLQLVRSLNAIKEKCSDVMIYRCRSCGASLSLLNGGQCEYCGSGLDLKKYDWVIKAVEIVRNK